MVSIRRKVYLVFKSFFLKFLSGLFYRLSGNFRDR